eukprot:3334669-Rhodomonas_salina.1
MCIRDSLLTARDSARAWPRVSGERLGSGGLTGPWRAAALGAFARARRTASHASCAAWNRLHLPPPQAPHPTHTPPPGGGHREREGRGRERGEPE